MTRPPKPPKLYHITHVDNLRDIGADGWLRSDRAMIERGGPAQAIGMSASKRRRVDELPVPCHPGTKVGDYVPFYFGGRARGALAERPFRLRIGVCSRWYF